MHRRRVLLTAGAALLGGCASNPSVDRDPVGSPSDTSTSPSTTAPATITDCRQLPDPPADPTQERAREFVAAYEEARVYNWLVTQNGGPDDCRPDEPGSNTSSRGTEGAVEIDVEAAETAVTADADGGFYVVSSCSGRARYWCPDEGRTCSSAGRNAHFVTHFVGDGSHVGVPSNWIACRVRDEPYRSPDAAENVTRSEDEPGMTFRVYDFREGDHDVDVTLTHLGAKEEVLAETYEPPHGPAVQSNVTVRRGDYRLVASAADDRTSHEFSLAGRADPSWDGVCIYLDPDGDLRVVEVATTGDLAVPESGCFDRHVREEGDDGES